MKKYCILGGFLFLAVPFLAPAAVIDFAGFADGTVLTNQDFGDGVTFSGTTILQCCGSDGTGSLNDAQFPPVGGSVDGVNVAYNPGPGNMTLDFTAPVDFFDAFFTYNDGLTIDAYDSTDTLIDSVSGACGASGSGANYVGSGCGAPNEELNITDPGEISQIVILGGTGNNFTIDDVSFTGSINAGAAPEPGSIVMLLGGLGGMVALARRRFTR